MVMEREDLRIMQIDSYYSNNTHLIAAALSDGTIKVSCCLLIQLLSFTLGSKDFKVIGFSDYHNRCCLAVRFQPIATKENEGLILLSTATDGRIAIWHIQLEGTVKMGSTPTKVIQCHQSGICAIDSFLVEDDVMILSCGDDSAICLSFLEASATLKIENAHYSCIQDVRFLTSTILVSISIDQRLKLWRVNEGSLTFLKEMIFDVADVSAMEVIRITEKDYLFALVGIGIEFIHVDIFSIN